MQVNNLIARPSGWLIACLTSWLGCFLLASDRLQGLLINSMLLSVGTLSLCLPVGTFLAIAITKTNAWLSKWLERALIVMLFVPLYVHATAWQAALGQGGYFGGDGLLGGWTGAVWVHGMAAVPWVVLFVAVKLRTAPRDLEEQALQDAPAWIVLIRISLRQADVGIAAAALWVTVICFSEIAVTDLFQVRTFAEEIYTAASLGVLDGAQVQQSATSAASVQVPLFNVAELFMGVLAVGVLVLAALIVLVKWVPMASFGAMQSDWHWRLGKGRLCWSILVCGVALVVIGLPNVGLLGKAGTQVEQVDGQVIHTWSAQKVASLFVSSPWQHRRELGWSLTIGIVVTTITVSVGVLVAWALRSRLLPTWLTAAVLSLLFAVPGPLLGVWLIRILNQPSDSWLYPLSWCYDYTILAPVLAQFLRALPPVVLVLASQFSSLPQAVIDSSLSEGANWLQQLARVTLPSCWPAVAAATCIAMIVSLGELAATLLVVPPGVSPLSVRIFGLIHYGAEDRVSALCLTMIATLSILIAIGLWLWRRLADEENSEL
ncbi:MAG: ABC transporter permease subunit [Planctomycetota bacterium]